VAPDETAPFETVQAADGREITFRITDRYGSRFERPVFARGVSGSIEWLWTGKIPLRRVTLIEGPAGAGKSTVALDLAAAAGDETIAKS
jgi:RecA/RadA recombinase